MTPFPRPDYRDLRVYDPGRVPVPVDLSDNTNLWGPHPAALARIRSAEPDDLRCYPEVYADTLRSAVAERFEVDTTCVTTGAGSDAVLDSAFRAASAPGSVVAFAAPTFSMVGDLALMNGMRPYPVDWGRAERDPESLLAEDPAVVYLCRPNNPTGALLPQGWVDRLLERTENGGALVVADEAYADFSGCSLIDRASRSPRLLVTRTCSKAFGLAGLRCGFGVAREDVVGEIEKARGPYSVSRLAAKVAAIALRDADGWVQRTVSESIENRSKLYDELQEREVRSLESHANFILVAAPSGSAAADTAALRRDGVAVRPFTQLPDVGEGLRVTVGPWPLMERFLSALDRRLGELKENAGP